MRAKRTFLAIYLLMTGVLSFAQIPASIMDSLKRVVSNGNLHEVKAFIERQKGLDTHIRIERQVFDSYWEWSYEAKESPGYVFDFISDSINIIYFKVISQKKKKYLHERKEAMEHFYRKYNEVYVRRVHADDFFSNETVYGRGCGFTGEDPPERKKMNACLEKNCDEKIFITWLQSPITELQMYGFEGGFILASKGCTLSPLAKKLMDNVAHKSGNVRICGGCIYSMKPISMVITEMKKNILQSIKRDDR